MELGSWLGLVGEHAFLFSDPFMGAHGIGKICGQEKNITTYNLAPVFR